MTTTTDIEAVYLFGALAGTPTSTGVCTCCDGQRPTFRYGGDNDNEESRDCDSTYGGSHIYRLNDRPFDWAINPGPNGASRVPDLHDLWRYLCGSLPSCSGPTTIEIEDGQMRWHTDTDEGYSGGHARICSESWCAYDDDTFSDSTAESMNY
jgi:hypothetical protein